MADNLTNTPESVVLMAAVGALGQALTDERFTAVFRAVSPLMGPNLDENAFMRTARREHRSVTAYSWPATPTTLYGRRLLAWVHAYATIAKISLEEAQATIATTHAKLDTQEEYVLELWQASCLQQHRDNRLRRARDHQLEVLTAMYAKYGVAASEVSYMMTAAHKRACESCQ